MAETNQKVEIGPQPGPQSTFLSSAADIVIYGGAGGGGKTYGLLLDPLRHYHNKAFQFVIFRRELTQISNPGGLWDESMKLYPLFGGEPRGGNILDWKFPGGLRVKFSHLNHETDKFNWQGTAVPGLGFDELTHFTESQFFYMLSRNRSMSGVAGYVRATCNPDPDSWVATFVAWWIDQETGYPIPERAGVLRYFIRQNDQLIWADSRQELESLYGDDCFPKSVTFIPAKVYDNKKLLETDPAYLSNLKAQCAVDRARLLDGNWLVRASSGTLFKKQWFEIVDSVPEAQVVGRVRFWDRAATEVSPSSPNPDWTAGGRIARTANGVFYIEDVERERMTPGKVETLIKNTALQDGPGVDVVSQQDPGSAGKTEAAVYAKLLVGFNVRALVITGDKVTRAKPASAQAEAGNIKLVRGRWNKAFLDELEAFPNDKVHDDQVDALSGGFNYLGGNKAVPRVRVL